MRSKGRKAGRLPVWVLLFCLLAGLAGLPGIAAGPVAAQAAAAPAVSGGGWHSLALKGDGTVWAWGRNDWGQLGDGTDSNRLTPVQVSGLDGMVSVSAGYGYSLAVKGDGKVLAWGRNYYGQLGDGTYTDRLAPVQVSGLEGAVFVSAGEYHSLAVKGDGTAWAWGVNGNGQLGDGTYTHRITPVQVSGLDGVVSVSAGGFHSLALKSDGTVWAWGSNSYGQLGDGTHTGRLAPVQVSGLGGVVSVSAGEDHSLALKSDGTVWAWGRNDWGQLGDGTGGGWDNCSYEPVQVSGLDGVVSVSARYWYSLAVKSDGTVWAWGYNWYGQLGDGTTSNRYTPGRVSGLGGVVSISAGKGHSLALKGDGTVWVWGDNSYGQLGDGTYTRRITPVQSLITLAGVCPESGELTVHIEPGEVCSLGATWSVDGGANCYADGATISLEAGSYTITFSEMDGWITPDPIVVDIAKDSNIVKHGTYDIYGGCWIDDLAALYTNEPVPSFKWTYRDSAGRAMRGYHIKVYENGTTLLWDSGEILATASANAQFTAPYKGRRLGANRNYSLQVRVCNGLSWSWWYAHNFALTTPVIYNPYAGVNWGKRMLVQLHAHYKDDWDREFNKTYGQDFYHTVRNKYEAKGYTNVFFTEHSGSNWETWLPPDHLDRSKAVECTGEKTHLVALGITELVTPFGKPPHLSSQELGVAQRVEQVVSQTWDDGTGALAIPAHPNAWTYPWSKELLDKADGAQAMEIYTGVLKHIPKLVGLPPQEIATGKWDAMLRENKVIWGVATDDYTPGTVLGLFGPDMGAIAIPCSGGAYSYSDRLVLDEIRRGAFYATTGSGGPEIEVRVEGDTINVTAPLTSVVSFISQKGVREKKTLLLGTTASYDISSEDKYVRVEVKKEYAIPIPLPPYFIVSVDRSWSQPIFVGHTGTTWGTIHPGEEGGLSLHSFTLNAGGGEETVAYKLSLPEDLCPATAPPGTEVGYPYYLEIEGCPGDPARLTISYANEVIIPYLVPSLSIYHLPPGETRWIKLDTDLDRAHKEVHASVGGEGWYTVSTDRSAIFTPMNITEPAIGIIGPEEGGVYNTPFTCEAEIIDDTGIWKMDFSLGDIWLGYDIWPDDGWSVEVDPSLYAVGEYTLTVVAEDLDGRITQAQRTVVLAGGVTPPTVCIDSPSPGSSIGAAALVTGTFSTESALQSIMVGINDIHLGEAEIEGNTWSCSIPGGLLPGGSYTLWAQIRDTYGNSARDEVTVHLSPVLQLSPSTDCLLPERPVQTWLTVGGLANSLGTVEVALNFDPTLLEISNVQEGDYLGGETEFSYSVDAVEGILEINMSRLSGDPASHHGGHLATIEVIPRRGDGTAELAFLSSTLTTPDGENIIHSTSGTEFTLHSPPVFENLPDAINLSVDKPFTFQVGAAHPGGREISFNLVGDDPVLLGAMTIGPVTGNLSWPEPVIGAYRLTVQARDDHSLTESAVQFNAVKYGSVKCDGTIDVSDAILLLRHIVGLTGLEPLQQVAGDVNGDGRVDVADAILILRRIVGLIDRFPVEMEE